MNRVFSCHSIVSYLVVYLFTLVVVCSSASTPTSTCGVESTIRRPSQVVETSKGRLLPSPNGDCAAKSGVGIAPHLVNIHNGRIKATLEIPPGLSCGCDAYSADGAKLAGVCWDQLLRRDSIIIWNAYSGEMLQRTNLPQSAAYVMTLRFSETGNVVYAGARNEIYELQLATNQLTTVIRDVSYYVRDIACHPGGNFLAFIDGQYSFGLREWSRNGQTEHRGLIREPMQYIQSLGSVDYSSDGSELAVLATVQDDGHRSSGSAILRFDLVTGKQISRLLVPSTAIFHKIRYIGDRKVLFVFGEGPGPGRNTGCFALIGPQTTDTIDNLYNLDSLVMGGAANYGINTHVTVGLANGQILQWLRQDFSENWIELLSK